MRAPKIGTKITIMSVILCTPLECTVQGKLFKDVEGDYAPEPGEMLLPVTLPDNDEDVYYVAYNTENKRWEFIDGFC